MVGQVQVVVIVCERDGSSLLAVFRVESHDRAPFIFWHIIL